MLLSAITARSSKSPRGLSPAPAAPHDLVDLGVRLAQSPAVTRHLNLIPGPFPDAE